MSDRIVTEYKDFELDTVFDLSEHIFSTIVFHGSIEVLCDSGRIDFVDRIPEGLIDFRRELDKHIERVKNAIDKKLECIPKNYPEYEDLN